MDRLPPRGIYNHLGHLVPSFSLRLSVAFGRGRMNLQKIERSVIVIIAERRDNESDIDSRL